MDHHHKLHLIYPKNSCFCLGSTVRGRPLFLSAMRGFLGSGVVSLFMEGPSSCTASRIVCRDRQRSMCSLNCLSSAACGLLHIGQSHHSSAACSFTGLGAISLPCLRYGESPGLSWLLDEPSKRPSASSI